MSQPSSQICCYWISNTSTTILTSEANLQVSCCHFHLTFLRYGFNLWTSNSSVTDLTIELYSYFFPPMSIHFTVDIFFSCFFYVFSLFLSLFHLLIETPVFWHFSQLMAQFMSLNGRFYVNSCLLQSYTIHHCCFPLVLYGSPRRSDKLLGIEHETGDYEAFRFCECFYFKLSATLCVQSELEAWNSNSLWIYMIKPMEYNHSVVAIVVGKRFCDQEFKSWMRLIAFYFMLLVFYRPS